MSYKKVKKCHTEIHFGKKMSYKNAKKVKKCHTEMKKVKKCHTKKCHTKNVTQKRLKNVIQSRIFLPLRQKSIKLSRKFLKKVDKKLQSWAKFFNFVVYKGLNMGISI